MKLPKLPSSLKQAGFALLTPKHKLWEHNGLAPFVDADFILSDGRIGSVQLAFELEKGVPVYAGALLVGARPLETLDNAIADFTDADLADTRSGNFWFELVSALVTALDLPMTGRAVFQSMQRR